MMEAIIEIGYKPGIFDATGEGVKKGISDLGIRGVMHVSTHQLYSIKGNFTDDNLEFIARNILCDPIVQYYRIGKESQKAKGASRKMFAGRKHFAAEVWFKKGVTDNVGDSVKKAIEDLGLRTVAEVHSGRKFIIDGKLQKTQVVNIATKLLANEIVEDYKIYGES